MKFTTNRYSQNWLAFKDILSIDKYTTFVFFNNARFLHCMLSDIFKYRLGNNTFDGIAEKIVKK